VGQFGFGRETNRLTTRNWAVGNNKLSIGTPVQMIIGQAAGIAATHRNRGQTLVQGIDTK